MGRSTTAMALTTPGIILCVDSWENLAYKMSGEWRDGEKSANEVYGTFLKNLAPQILAGKVITFRMPSADASRVLKDILGDQLADMIFIDGDHKFESVTADITNYLPLLDPKGLLCGHDFQHPPLREAVKTKYPGVTVAPNTTIWTASPFQRQCSKG